MVKHRAFYWLGLTLSVLVASLLTHDVYKVVVLACLYIFGNFLGYLEGAAYQRQRVLHVLSDLRREAESMGRQVVEIVNRPLNSGGPMSQTVDTVEVTLENTNSPSL